MIRFIHTADNHLGTPFVGLGTKNQAMAKKAIQASYQAFEKVITTAIQERVDFVVIAGDLYDSSQQHIKEIVFVNQQFKRLEDENIPVFLSQGNHDYEQSFHLQLPKNVYLYGKEVESVTHTTANGEKVVISGFSYPTRWVTERMVEQFPLRNQEADYHIGMYHGYFDGSTANTGHYAPFSIKEMQEKRYDYWALGHIHKRQVLTSNPPIVYSGNTQGFKRSELGEKGAYLVTLSKEDDPKLEFFKTSAIEWLEVDISLTGKVTLDEVINTIEENLKKRLANVNDLQLISIKLSDYDAVEANVLKNMNEADFIEVIDPKLRSVLNDHQIYKVRLMPLVEKKLWPKQAEIEQSFEDSVSYFMMQEHYQEALDDLFMQVKFTQEFSDWRNDQELMDEIIAQMKVLIQQEFTGKGAPSDED